MMVELSINDGRFVLINETSGNVCFLNAYNGRMVASRSTCYRIRREMSHKFPKCVYAVYELMRLGK